MFSSVFSAKSNVYEKNGCDRFIEKKNSWTKGIQNYFQTVCVRHITQASLLVLSMNRLIIFQARCLIKFVSSLLFPSGPAVPSSQQFMNYKQLNSLQYIIICTRSETRFSEANVADCSSSNSLSRAVREMNRLNTRLSRSSVPGTFSQLAGVLNCSLVITLMKYIFLSSILYAASCLFGHKASLTTRYKELHWLSVLIIFFFVIEGATENICLVWAACYVQHRLR